MDLIVVDDNKLERDGIAKMLTNIGLDVNIKATFDNGETAFGYLLDNRVDIVISDIQMPLMTGIELIRRLNESEINTKVIFVSCYDDFEYARSAIEQEASGYVLKPIVKADLKSAVYKAIESIKKERNTELNLESLRESEIDIRIIQSEVRELILNGDREACSEFVNRYLLKNSAPLGKGYLNDFAHAVVYSVQLTLLEYNKSLEMKVGSALWTKLADFESIMNLEQWILNILYFSNEILNSPKEDNKERIVYEIKNIIAERYNAHLTASDIADALLYSAKFLNYTFRNSTGKSILDYLTEYRMEKAKELLREPDSKIYAVAELVGYKRKTHFNDLFKQYEKMSPSEYKALYN